MTTLHRIADRPTWILGRAHRRAQRLLHAAFADAGIRGYHYRVLAALDEHGPASQADIGRLVGMDRSDVAAVVADLLERREVRRAPDPADRRRNIVALTAGGRRALERLDGVVGAVQDEVLAPLTATERATLTRLLRKLDVGDPSDPAVTSGARPRT